CFFLLQICFYCRTCCFCFHFGALHRSSFCLYLGSFQLCFCCLFGCFFCFFLHLFRFDFCTGSFRLHLCCFFTGLVYLLHLLRCLILLRLLGEQLMFCWLLLGGVLFLFIELPFDYQLAFFGVHIQLSAAGFFHFGSFYRPDNCCHYDHCNSQYLGSAQR